MTQEAQTPPVEDDRPFADFAAFIEQLKAERGLKQSDIARAVGVAPSQPSGWATGRSRPRPETLGRLAEVYGLNLDQLFQLCRYRVQAEQTADPDETELLALIRQLPDEHRPTVKSMLWGLARRRDHHPEHVDHDVTDLPEDLGRPKTKESHQVPSTRRRIESRSVDSMIAKYGLLPA